MKWITREQIKIDRVACPWLIKRFIDRDAEFIFVPASKVLERAKAEGAIAYDIPNVELSHRGKECTFEAILRKYGLFTDPTLSMLSRIVNGAGSDNTLWNQPEAVGLRAITEGFRHLGYADDQSLIAAESIVYDALYLYCKALTNPTLRSQKTYATANF